jgi:predicted nuclease with TOPRIM domain
MEIFKNIATVVGCISACIALLITIIKPLRQILVNSIAHKSQYQKMIDNIEKLNNKLDESLTNDANIQKRLEKVEKNVLENEVERLKSELSTYYNKCCRGLQIFPEEMLRIDEVYDKYHNKLGLNHIGTKMYDAIEKYYKQQDFIKIHND